MLLVQKQMRRSVRKECIRAIKVVFPVMLSLIPFGMLLGTQAIAHGMSVLELFLMCSLNFAGGSEFVAVGLWQNVPPLLLIMLMTFLVNCRHILMGATIIPFCRRLSLPKVMLSFFLLCDECWALSLQDSYRRRKEGYRLAFSYPFYLTIAISLYVVWVSSALFGALVGPLFGDLTRYGFDMAFVAVFIVLLRGMWSGWRRGIPWAASLVVACIVYVTVPGVWYVIAGTSAGLAVVLLTPAHFFQVSNE